jgi:hypothetical protein
MAAAANMIFLISLSNIDGVYYFNRWVAPSARVSGPILTGKISLSSDESKSNFSQKRKKDWREAASHSSPLSCGPMLFRTSPMAINVSTARIVSSCHHRAAPGTQPIPIIWLRRTPFALKSYPLVSKFAYGQA